MREFALIVTAIPVLWFAWHCWGRAVTWMRDDAKATAALRLASVDPHFARIYGNVRGPRDAVASNSTWKHEETGERPVLFGKES